jgi:hypothetical protein
MDHVNQFIGMNHEYLKDGRSIKFCTIDTKRVLIIIRDLQLFEEKKSDDNGYFINNYL